MFDLYDEDLLRALKITGFDLKNFDILAVSFDPQSSLTRLYKASKSMNLQKNDFIIVPVQTPKEFSLVRVCAKNEDIQHDNGIDVEHLVDILTEGGYEIREVIGFVGNKNKGMIKEYYEKLEKQKRKDEIIKQLEERAEEANKMLIYKQLASSDDEVKRLLNELEEII